MTREEYNDEFGYQFAVSPDEPEYDPCIYMIIVYGSGSHIEMAHPGSKTNFHLVVERSEYASNDLFQLEERLWDDFAKFEDAQLCVEEQVADLNERLEFVFHSEYIGKDRKLDKIKSIVNEITKIR